LRKNKVRLEEVPDNRGGVEHRRIEAKIIDALNKADYDLKLEHTVHVNGRRYSIDIFGERNGNVILVEVGWCDESKLLNLMSQYPIVIHIPFTKEYIYEYNLTRQERLLFE